MTKALANKIRKANPVLQESDLYREELLAIERALEIKVKLAKFIIPCGKSTGHPVGTPQG